MTDVVKQLKLDATVVRAPYGELPDLAAVDPASDVVFTWNGTTSGVRVPDGDWIADDRAGLTICDATSAAFAVDLPWDKLDVATFSWQKVLGGEGGHGVLILGAARGRAAGEPRPGLAAAQDLPADERRQADRGHLQGRDDQHAVDARGRGLYLGAGMGRAAGRPRRADRARRRQCGGARRPGSSATPWIEHLAADPATRSNTSVCLKFADGRASDEEAGRALAKRIDALLEPEGAAYDIAGYRDAPPGLRIWCGATVETADIEALGPWLDWAFHEATQSQD